MTRFTLLLAAGLGLCAGFAAADPSNRGVNPQVSPEDRPYLAAHAVHNGYPRARGTNGLARHGLAGQPRNGSRTRVVQTGTNNSATITQRGSNKTAVVVQRGSDTEVIINQHGDGPGGAWVMTW